ncbi:MAG: hypothetical protein UY82_C0029G0002 [Candidatus Uhrbacteria bacterium GW2011_GWC2_53_7]|uniref:Uncharacterized protein n=1 Tax=Candidatus Uhrbacteria bacterium GW2011_GWC2_53_7 TaxID=1618986 RepID=A0A0G1XZ09_9BACT|nr:MAG: hypothetical protein UY82_C0029G0002 [Candidatus Uhrbacteria bacterium GW2011_GWC2_53_7]
MIAAEYRREIVRETSRQDEVSRQLARFIPSLRPPTTMRHRPVLERHFDPNTVKYPLHGRLVYAWRPNARHDNMVGLEQAQTLRELQTRLRNEARADELRMFEGVVERVRDRHNGHTPTELADFVARQKAERGESGHTSPELEAEAMHTRRLDFARTIARGEIQRVACGFAPGFLGWGEDQPEIVWRHVLAEVVGLMELDPKRDRALLEEALDSRWFEDVLRQEVASSKQAAEVEIDWREEDAEIFYLRLERPRGGNKAVECRAYRSHQRGTSPHWKRSTRCRKQWEMRPCGIR